MYDGERGVAKVARIRAGFASQFDRSPGEPFGFPIDKGQFAALFRFVS